MHPIKKRRVALEMTQAALAEKAGVSRATISVYEKGRTYPRINVISSIAEALGCSASDLSKEVMEATNR